MESVMWNQMFKSPVSAKATPLYYMYEMAHAAVTPARFAAKTTQAYFNHPLNPTRHTPIARAMQGAAELFERTTRRYGKPIFDLPTTLIEDKEVEVREEIVWQRPFCNLIHFKRDLPKTHPQQPALLMIAPMSGHYATLLRDTVKNMLPDYEIYVTDWIDARDVPLSQGQFDLNDYIDYLIDIFHHIGKGLHVMAVCQPCVPALAAVAYMEKNGDEAGLPASLILMGGPIDTRCRPTAVNDLAKEKGLDWFQDNVIVPVPFPHAGMMRPVYPGFLQLTGFMSMNLDRHMDAHRKLFDNLVEGDGDSAEKHREFYDEYLAVMDLTAEFYMQTLDEVFLKHSLPDGNLMHQDEYIDLKAIRKTALMTIEGERDDITGIGQTKAALTLCSSLEESKKLHYEQKNVGHYGVFSGSKFRTQVMPKINDFIKTHRL